MKRIALILAAAIALAAMLPGAALAAAGDANIARYDDVRERYRDYVRGGCALGDVLYLVGTEHLFTWRAGEADVTALEFSLPEADEGERRDLECVFAGGEQLWALSALSESDEEGVALLGAELWPLMIDGDDVHVGEAVEVDVDELTADYDGNTYFVQVNSACWVNGYLLLYVYDAYGEPGVYALEVESGEGWYADVPEDICCVAAYGEKLLIEAADYDERVLEFYLYDPEEDEAEPACAPVEMEEESYETYGGLAYSEESGRLFYLSNGYLMAAEEFDFANAGPVSELSLNGYSAECCVVLPGDLYACVSGSGTAVRATDPGALPDTRLVVQSGYSDAVTAAYYSFGAAHPDVAVVLDQDSWSAERMVEAMMNRDDSRDIFLLPVYGEAYGALFERGFMAELDDAAIVDGVARMYPAVRSAIERDGDVLAVPVQVYGWLPGLDYEGFEEIGISREEVPDTWKGLLELLPELPERLPEDGSVRIFEEYQDRDSLRGELIGTILEYWRVQFAAAGEQLRYDDAELIELLELAQSLDYAALGVKEADRDGEAYAYAEVDAGGAEARRHTLIQTSTGCTIGNFYGGAEPALLRAATGLPPCIPLQMTVAFVNPYSKHRELAQAFLAEVLKNLSAEAAYNLSDELNEPVRNEEALKNIEEMRARVEELRAELANAEPVDAVAIEEDITGAESYIEAMQQYSWAIPAEDIAWYRARAEYLTVVGYNYLDAADEDGELSDLAEQLLAGRVSPENFLKEADRKVRMRAMEGN